MSHRTRRATLLGIIIPIFHLFGCQSWNKFWVDGSVTSFSFEPAQTRLAKSYTGVISGNSISVTMPYGPEFTALAPTFSANASHATVANTEQISGVTKNDFTAPVTYTFYSASGIPNTYTVSIFLLTPLSDTGQTGCYDGGVSTCAATAASYPRQDGDFLDFPQKSGIQPQAADANYPADYYNLDTLTGVTWKACDEGQTGPSCSGGAAASGQSAGITTCNNLNSANSGAGYAGRRDWRLPHFLELMQFQRFNVSAQFVDSTLFPGLTSASRWSSSLILPSATSGLNINGTLSSNSISTSLNIHCVAGGAFPAPSWQDNGDGTVLDRRSGLYWQKCGVGQINDAACSGSITGINWSTALTTCQSLTLGGRSWRLPNVNEAISLIDLTKTAAPYVNATYFPNFPPAGAPTPEFWTSTSLVANPAYAYVFDYSALTSGTIDAKGTTVNGTSFSYVARCVSGP
jgi:hypothetical protein